MKKANIPAWAQVIVAYVPGDELERTERETMLRLIARFGDALLWRDQCPFAHFTASSVIVSRDRKKTLMAYHRIYKSWAWTGGHNDGEGDFLSVAVREALEETGVQGLSPLGACPASLEILPVWAHRRRGETVGSHLHLNLSYLFEADETLPVRPAQQENSDVRWLDICNLRQSVTEPPMLPVYEKILKRCEQSSFGCK